MWNCSICEKDITYKNVKKHLQSKRHKETAKIKLSIEEGEDPTGKKADLSDHGFLRVNEQGQERKGRHFYGSPASDKI